MGLLFRDCIIIKEYCEYNQTVKRGTEMKYFLKESKKITFTLEGIFPYTCGYLRLSMLVFALRGYLGWVNPNINGNNSNFQSLVLEKCSAHNYSP